MSVQGASRLNIVSYVLLATVVVAPVLVVVQALLVKARNTAAFARTTQKLDHE